MSQQPPEWWSRRQGPRLGCADVTIVSIASITAFVVLLLVLGRSDILLERLPGNNANPTVSSSKNGDPTEVSGAIVPRPTAQPVATLPPSPAPTASPTAAPAATPTPAFKRANVRQSCRVRPDASTTQAALRILQPGTVVRQLGEVKRNEGVDWQSVELDDSSGLRGWMQQACFE